MAQQLRWENVAPVSLSDAANMYSAANVGLQQGLASLAHAATAYKDMNQEEANKQLANNISKYNTSADLSKAYTSGDLYNGVDKDWLDSSHTAGIQGQILTLAKNERDNALAAQKAATEKANSDKIYSDMAYRQAVFNNGVTVNPDGTLVPSEGANAYIALHGLPAGSGLAGLNHTKYADEQIENTAAGKMAQAGLNAEAGRKFLEANNIDRRYWPDIFAKMGWPLSGANTPLADAATPNAAGEGNFGTNHLAKEQGAPDPDTSMPISHWASHGARVALNTKSKSSAAGVGQLTISNLLGKNKDGLWYQAGLKDNDLFNPENQLKVLDYTVNKYKSNPNALRTLWSFLPKDMSSMSVDDIKDAIIRHENGTSLTKLQNYISQGKQTAQPTNRYTSDLNDAIQSGSPNAAIEAAKERANIFINAYNSRHNQELSDPSYIIASGGKQEDRGKTIGELASKYELDLGLMHRVSQAFNDKATPAAVAALILNTKEDTGILHPFNFISNASTGFTPILGNAITTINKGGGIEGATKKYTPILNRQSSINNLSNRLNAAYDHFLKLAQGDGSAQSKANMDLDRSTIQRILESLGQATSS